MSDSPRVLFVDDDALVRRTFERLARWLGVDAQIAAGVAAAEAVLAEHDFDLVITDLRMPGGGGMRVLEASRGKGIPVIVVSGFATPGEEAQIREAGVHLLGKPFGASELKEAMAEVLGDRRGD